MRRLLLALALTACAASAAADVTLLAPRAGERLEGGSDATVAWNASMLPAHADEWEAFLSIDGGRTYAVRITPHLDRALRTFTFRVPNVASSDVRLLLRVGDESDETRIEFPQSFSIAATAKIDWNVVRSTEVGNDGAVEWVTSDLVRHRSGGSSASRAPVIDSVLPDDAVAAVGAPAALHPDDSASEITITRHQPPRVDCAAARPLLLLSTRMNV